MTLKWYSRFACAGLRALMTCPQSGLPLTVTSNAFTVESLSILAVQVSSILAL